LFAEEPPSVRVTPRHCRRGEERYNAEAATGKARTRREPASTAALRTPCRWVGRSRIRQFGRQAKLRTEFRRSIVGAGRADPEKVHYLDLARCSLARDWLARWSLPGAMVARIVTGLPSRMTVSSATSPTRSSAIRTRRSAESRIAVLPSSVTRSP